MSIATRCASRVSSSDGAPKLVPRVAANTSAFVSAFGACPWMSGPHDIT